MLQMNAILETKRRQQLYHVKKNPDKKRRDHLDCHEYLEDPAGYFLRKEHWSLDG